MTKPRLPVLSGLTGLAQRTSLKPTRSERDGDRYLLSFEVDTLRKGTMRHHWMICSVENPDQLLSWGHAPTPERAETDAKKEIQSLSSGMSQGGQVKSTVMPAIRRRAY